jgi:hypothetical protein
MSYIITPQYELLLKVTNSAEPTVIFITGPVGCGKSALLKAWEDSTGRAIENAGSREALLKDAVTVKFKVESLDREMVEILKESLTPRSVVFVVATEEGRYGHDQLPFDQLPEAWKEAFTHVVEVDYLENQKEVELLVSRTGIEADDATKLVDIASCVRRNWFTRRDMFSSPMSTRRLLVVAKCLKMIGMEGLRSTLANLYSAKGGLRESERSSIIQYIKGKWGTIWPSERHSEKETPRKK